MTELLVVIPPPYATVLVPTRRVGMQYRRAAPREAVESPLVRQWVRGTGRSARERDVIVAVGK
ncbi:hypothetical protein [Methylobacter tundripaludum]|uniref:Uncharacterized protein n=1 Tax=Methylobacter tundripaludum (strain ATCC BAA-1195 / DSM 17260 / SV96) TaxID=697282 RepID=G3IT33_METTV|nr:hypothetical protein [Methylobacter tundripaludum]EGW21317.1 hypothetical protein Mettu_0075 [Methylobacter tundripaludum SV96]